jgi:hypothetical protein
MALARFIYLHAVGATARTNRDLLGSGGRCNRMQVGGRNPGSIKGHYRTLGVSVISITLLPSARVDGGDRIQLTDARSIWCDVVPKAN